MSPPAPDSNSKTQQTPKPARTVAAVDYRRSLTPLTLEHIVRQTQPDLILLTSTTGDMGLGQTAGVEMLTSALQDEVALTADVPVIEVARTSVR